MTMSLKHVTPQIHNSNNFYLRRCRRSTRVIDISICSLLENRNLWPHHLSFWCRNLHILYGILPEKLFKLLRLHFVWANCLWSLWPQIHNLMIFCQKLTIKMKHQSNIHLKFFRIENCDTKHLSIGVEICPFCRAFCYTMPDKLFKLLKLHLVLATFIFPFALFPVHLQSLILIHA